MSTRRLAAILAIDVVGSSALIEADETAALSAIHSALSTSILPSVQAHGGKLIKTTGDGGLFEFASAVQAVECALTLQGEFQRLRDSGSQKLQFRMGINLGDVVIADDGDLYGDGVNVAVRLEGFGRAWRHLHLTQGVRGTSRQVGAVRPRYGPAATQEHQSPCASLLRSRQEYVRNRGPGSIPSHRQIGPPSSFCRLTT